MGEPQPHDNFLEKWLEWNSLEITHAELCLRGFRICGVGVSVAEGVIGKIYCPCREDPLSSAVWRRVSSGRGKRENLICRVNNELSSAK